MLTTIWDDFALITTIKFFPGLVIALFVLISYWLVRLMTDSIFLACLFTPFVAFGALVSHYVLTHNYAMPLSDKDSNTVLAIAVGVVAALVTMMVVTRACYALGDVYRRLNRRSGTLPSV